VLSGQGAFIVQGTFEEASVVPGTAPDGGRINYPSRKFMMFDAPMTCLQYVTKWYPFYYGHLADGRLVYSWESDGYGLYYTNYNQVLFPSWTANPDGGANIDAGYYYYASNNTTQVPYTSPIALTSFPSRTNIVYGEVVSRSTSTPVGPGAYRTGNAQQGLVAAGNIPLQGQLDRNAVKYESNDGGINYTTVTSGELDGNFGVTLFVVSNTNGFDAGVQHYPDGGVNFDLDGGIPDAGSSADAGSVSGSFVAVPCSF